MEELTNYEAKELKCRQFAHPGFFSIHHAQKKIRGVGVYLPLFPLAFGFILLFSDAY